MIAPHGIHAGTIGNRPTGAHLQWLSIGHVAIEADDGKVRVANLGALSDSRDYLMAGLAITPGNGRVDVLPRLIRSKEAKDELHVVTVVLALYTVAGSDCQVLANQERRAV